MENNKFSIIIPVYNSEKYLKRCIESVRNQTYSVWELILVDDGSLDSSWQIINQYCKNDARIIGVHQDNAGPGMARNKGISMASGDYLVFVDSDDYISKDYLELLNPLAEKNDLVFIDVDQVDLKGTVIRNEKMSVYASLDKDLLLRKMMTGNIPWGGVRKTVRRSLICDNGIGYSNLKIGEEALFSFRTVYAARTIGFLNSKAVYMYEVHQESQSTLKIDDPWGGTIKVLKDYLCESGNYDHFASTINAFNVSSTIVSIDRISNTYCGIERKKKLQDRLRTYKHRNDLNYGIDYAALPLKAKIFVPFLNQSIILPIVAVSILRKQLRKLGGKE